MYGDLVRMMPGNLDSYGVDGVAGAERFQSQPNQRYALFDKNEDYVYFFTTDGSNNKSTIRRCEFKDKPVPKLEDMFTPKEEFNSLKEEMSDVKQSIQQLLELVRTANANESVSSIQSQPTATGGIIPRDNGQNKGSIKAI